MKEWFEELSSREQSILLFGGLALIIMLVYSLIWAPLNEETQRLHQDVERQQADLLWMEQNAKQFKSSGGPGLSVASSESLLSIVDRSAKSAQLGGSIKRIQPDKDGSVRIWLEDVKFEKMLVWMSKLSSEYGVVLDDSNIEKQQTPALVDARLTLKKGGA